MKFLFEAFDEDDSGATCTLVPEQMAGEQTAFRIGVLRVGVLVVS